MVEERDRQLSDMSGRELLSDLMGSVGALAGDLVLKDGDTPTFFIIHEELTRRLDEYDRRGK